MNNLSFFQRYGLAYICYKTNLPPEKITSAEISSVLKGELGYFRLTTHNSPQVDDILEYRYTEKERGDAKSGTYLSSHILSNDKKSGKTFLSIKKIIDSLSKKSSLNQKVNFDKSITITTSKINNGRISQSVPTGSLYEVSLCAIATITVCKPALYDPLLNVYLSLIPDLPLNDLISFIKVFDEMQNTGLMDDIFSYKVNKSKPSYKRPKISFGNYPFAPPDSKFSAIGLPAALGRWAKEAKTHPEEIKKVIRSLENTRIYIMSYDGVHHTKFSHSAVRLSERGDLFEFINSFYRAGWEQMKDKNENERKLFFMMTARFLQFFTAPYFKDFLAFRMEYQHEIFNLFKEYFSMAGINEHIIDSASALGRWINRSAYFAAKESTDDKTNFEKINKAKAKILAEIESTVMAAKTETALVSQVITRIGRLSYNDAPAEAELFVQSTVKGEISLQNAKDLIMAFSRIKNTKSENTNSNNYLTEEE